MPGTRASRSPSGSSARVVTDLKIGAAFPTDHPLHVGAPGARAGARGRSMPCAPPTSSSASTGSTSAAPSRVVGGAIAAKVIQVSLDQHLHNGWSMDYQGLPPVDVLHRLRARRRGAGAARRARPRRPARESHRSRDEFPEARRRQAHRRSSGRRAAPRGRRPPHLSHPRLAVLARRKLAVPPSARLSRLRRRRRRRRRTRASRSAPRWRSRAPAACRSRSAATAIS